MKRSLSVMAVVLALTVAGLDASIAPGAPVRAAAAKNCKEKAAKARTAVLVRVTNISCTRGRQVAARVVRRPPSGCVTAPDAQHRVTLVKPCSQLGYRCVLKRSIARGLALDISCKSGARIVRFQY